MVTVERIKSDGSIKSYVVEGARPKPPKTRRPSRPRRRPYLSVVSPEIESELGVLSMPSTWADTNPRYFNRSNRDDFDDDEEWDCEYEELATEVEQPYLEREPKELLVCIRGRRDRACHRSRRRHVKLAVYENHQFVGWQSKYAMTHKRGQPSGRKPRKDIARETIRHMQPVEVEVYEPLHWIDELELPDMGMVPHHALEAEESMIELVAA